MQICLTPFILSTVKSCEKIARTKQLEFVEGHIVIFLRACPITQRFRIFDMPEVDTPTRLQSPATDSP